MKKTLKKLKKHFKQEIEEAKHAGIESVLLSPDCNEPIFLDIGQDDRSLSEIAACNGWHNQFLVIDFKRGTEKVLRCEEEIFS